MNRLLARATVFCILHFLLISAQVSNYNQGARTPTPPGYNISDYFELVPEKVKNNFIRFSRSPVLHVKLETKIVGNIVNIIIPITMLKDPPELTLFAISGKTIYKSIPTDKIYRFSLARLPKGIYIISLKTKKASVQTQVIYY